MGDKFPQTFASKDRALVIAPAGCGKTELIVKAVAYQNKGRSLILTHTHAGVWSLRERFKRFKVSPRHYTIDTIAGFALRYASAYPQTSGLDEFIPQKQAWDQVYKAGKQIVLSSVGKRVLQLSYTGLYVDEYQDCTLDQHDLIVSMANILPCRIVGDPLQGIFDFENVVKWSQDVFPNFENLPELQTAWRWKDKNKHLGDRLQTIRKCLLEEQSFDLRHSPIEWEAVTPGNQLKACFASLRKSGESIVAIHKWPRQTHSIAQKLKGTFTSMEEVESRDLFTWAKKIEESTGPDRVEIVINFASACMTKVSTELSTIKSKFKKSEIKFTNKIKHLDIALALSEVSCSSSLAPILDALELIEDIKGRSLYRRELWQSMKATIVEYETGQHNSLADAAWKVRDRGRVFGRIVERRTVSRTLLIKGLEFDHAIVLDTRELNAKELYVAMTRGAKSLIVLSPSPILKRDKPNFG